MGDASETVVPQSVPVTPEPNKAADATQSAMKAFLGYLDTGLTQEQAGALNTDKFPASFDPVQLPSNALGPVTTVNATFLGQLYKVNLVTLTDLGGKSFQIADVAANAVSQALLEAKKQNLGAVQVTESFRSRETQAERRKAYETIVDGVRQGNFAVKPGTSLHELGLAIDFNINGSGRNPLLDKFEKIAKPFGLFRTALDHKESWHFEYQGPTKSIKLVLNAIIDSTKQQLDANLASGLKNIVKEATLASRDTVQAAARASAITQLDRKSYFSAASTSLDVTKQTKSQEGAQLASTAAASSQDITSPTNINAYLYNFETGVWGDGKPNGIPSTGG